MNLSWLTFAQQQSTNTVCFVSVGSATCSIFRLALSLVGLFAKVVLDFLAKHEHAQVGVRGLVHGLGLNAHAILFWSQFVRTQLLMPQVEESCDRSAHHYQVTPQILPVQVDVLHSPAFHLKVKSSLKFNTQRHHF